MKKDNFTDVTQVLPKTPVNQTPTPPPQPQQVINTTGTVITLGKKK
jgi:hypothetical protein